MDTSEKCSKASHLNRTNRFKKSVLRSCIKGIDRLDRLLNSVVTSIIMKVCRNKAHLFEFMQRLLRKQIMHSKFVYSKDEVNI